MSDVATDSPFLFLAGKTIERVEEVCASAVKVWFTDGSAVEFDGVSAQGQDALYVQSWEPGQAGRGREIYYEII